MPNTPQFDEAQDDMETFTFGNTTVRARRLTPEERQIQVKASQEAMERFRNAFLKPGVRIKRKKGVPLYYLSPDTPPGVMIRELDGKKTRGRFVGNRFVPERPKSKTKARP